MCAAGFVAILGAVILAGPAAGQVELLGLMPACLLPIALLFGRYPGEGLIVRVARPKTRTRPTPADARARPWCSQRAAALPLLLLRNNLVLRGPPRTASATT